MVLHATGMGYDIIIYLRNNLWHCTVTASLILLLVENVAYMLQVSHCHLLRLDLDLFTISMVSKTAVENFNSEFYWFQLMFPHVSTSCTSFHSCWLSSGNGSHAIWTFVAPMLAIILVRMIMCLSLQAVLMCYV